MEWYGYIIGATVLVLLFFAFLFAGFWMGRVNVGKAGLPTISSAAGPQPTTIEEDPYFEPMYGPRPKIIPTMEDER